jgi:5-methylcytosine-specific restriction endonuclease McrA
MEARTLLLSSWYLPVRVLCWQDAVKMIYEQRVEVLAEYEEEIRSPSTVWKTPAVVRLLRTYRYRHARVRFSRLNVYVRDGFRCQYCGADVVRLTLDHVVPRSRGGRTDFENVVAACQPCNARKGNLTCDQAGMFPRRQPVTPASLPLRKPRVDARAAPLEWRPFIAPNAA